MSWKTYPSPLVRAYASVIEGIVRVHGRKIGVVQQQRRRWIAVEMNGITRTFRTLSDAVHHLYAAARVDAPDVRETHRRNQGLHP